MLEIIENFIFGKVTKTKKSAEGRSKLDLTLS